MKKLFISLFSLVVTCAFAQVAIGKTSISNSSVSLEFYDGADNVKAMVLPWVTKQADVAGAVDGTIIYDSDDKKVKYRRSGNWFDLSVNTDGAVDTSLQNGLTERASAKTQIGGNPTTDTTPGILVLADTDKAMVLPKVASPHLTIVKPEPGTIVYDTVTKQLCVYNGTVWSFWKP
ncbi:hypothetical protein [Soonwooa sp.]|uniref:hypothetical protein n=1 Tax=Soonwooa sp. TaxID=1938592 RepID=UPI00262400DC|nr:hypothetical protein [Soonwooa sp.]